MVQPAVPDKLDKILRGSLRFGPGQATTCNSVLLTSFLLLRGGLFEAPEEVSLLDAGV